MKALVLMIQFLTRIPIPWQVPCEERDFERGIYAFTTVGLILGVILVSAFSWLKGLYLDSFSFAILLVLLHVLMTGGLHLDGVADSADGLFSNRSKVRILEIMKDSRIGSNGVIALIFVILLKVIGVSYFVNFDLPLFLLAMPVVGRLSVVYAFYWGRSPRESGMGNLFIGKAKWLHLLVNSIVAMLLITLNVALLIPTLVAILATYIIVRLCTAKVDGITGDVLGAIIEMAEVVFCIIALFLS